MFGFVSMKQAVLLETARRSSPRSTLPSLSRISRVTKPAIVADAGFVPCAVSGSSTSVRSPSSPRSRKYARTISIAAYSPWAPAAGWRDTSGSPVMRERIRSSRQITSSDPCTVASGWYGCTPVAPALRASSSVTLGLYFMVQEPSG